MPGIMRFHIRPQHIIHEALIPLALIFEEAHNIRVIADG
jgi:hypothetical protein